MQWGYRLAHCHKKAIIRHRAVSTRPGYWMLVGGGFGARMLFLYDFIRPEG
ncbi:hypothetical protein predicted by Glimmer/Critica [Acetobacter ghanensis]|uniref:Uncharacterized protein n=1 Tax=Acetobacter ghanensis TaxID=431306 RepID=A0A0U5BF47_9PROT|nr:hypothetical protein predicted by Glimmer/Critica [Acetobacter ghanensis]